MARFPKDIGIHEKYLLDQIRDLRSDIRSAFSSSTSILGLGLSIVTLLIGIALIETRGTPPKLTYPDALYVSVVCCIITGFLYIIVAKQSWNAAYAAHKITMNAVLLRNLGYSDIEEPKRVFAPSTTLNLFFIIFTGIILTVISLWLLSFCAVYNIIVNVIVVISLIGGILIVHAFHSKFIKAIMSTLEKKY